MVWIGNYLGYSLRVSGSHLDSLLLRSWLCPLLFSIMRNHAAQIAPVIVVRTMLLMMSLNLTMCRVIFGHVVS